MMPRSPSAETLHQSAGAASLPLRQAPGQHGHIGANDILGDKSSRHDIRGILASRVDRLVHHPSIDPRCAADWARPVAGHPVGPGGHYWLLAKLLLIGLLGLRRSLSIQAAGGPSGVARARGILDIQAARHAPLRVA